MRPRAAPPGRVSALAPAPPPAVVLACVALALALACTSTSRRQAAPTHGDGSSPPRAASSGAPPPERPPLAPLLAGQAYLYDSPRTARAISPAEVSERNLAVVDLGDRWAPYILQDGQPPRPNLYRQTFTDLANDLTAPGVRPSTPVRNDPAGDPLPLPDPLPSPVPAPTVAPNFLEPFGIPPTLSVLSKRVEDDTAPSKLDCEAHIDVDSLRAFAGNNIAFIDRAQSRRSYEEAQRDWDWFEHEVSRHDAAAIPSSATGASRAQNAPPPAHATPDAVGGDRWATLAALRAAPLPRVRLRVERFVRGQQSRRAILAAQARLRCDGLLSPRSRFVPGAFDLPTHEALARWERKNDIFGWGQLGGETLAALQRASAELDVDTFKRVLAERVADAAAIIEDGSAPPGKSSVTVPNLIGDHVQALLAAVQVAGPKDLRDFLRQHGTAGLGELRVAYAAPPLPPYYTPEPGHTHMNLSVRIDRGDIWYDFPFDSRGRAIEQPRMHFPHLMLFVKWRGEDIPLCSWRTTIGSWRSELHANGRVYYRYKNSDVGPRVWKHIVAAPVWIPPDSTLVKDLLVRRVSSLERGPEWVVNTEVMGPGFQSAYGLVMAIHLDAGGADNQIRTHGSVDYTSIARRFSHGCHRLVNSRAVRMFDFILRRQLFRRIGALPLDMKRQFTVDGRPYGYDLKTRGYYYELANPISVDVTEGQIMGRVKRPITAYLRKAGVDYRGVEEASAATAATDATDDRNASAAPAVGPSAPVDPSTGDPSTGDAETRIDVAAPAPAPASDIEAAPSLGP